MITQAIHLVALSFGAEELLVPRIPLVDFEGTEARSIDDFLGQVLLVDFFAHWCAPCAREVPHLNELHEALGGRGFNLLGVTGDDAETARDWLEGLQARYPHARDADLRMQIELGFHPLPFAVLVDDTGVILWSGNPRELEVETIEPFLEHALAGPAHRWPAEASAVREALGADMYDRARKASVALGERGTRLLDLVERMVTRRLELMEEALLAQDYLLAEEIASKLEAGLVPAEVSARRASAVRAFIRDDESARSILEGQRELHGIWSEVASVQNVKQAEQLAERIRESAGRHPGTQVERRSQSLLKTIEALKSILP